MKFRIDGKVKLLTFVAAGQGPPAPVAVITCTSLSANRKSLKWFDSIFS
ncbi:hypothetical protein ACFX59_09385 [Sphingomonas sp. NCPPB 2930]